MSDFSFDGGDGFEPQVEITETGPCARSLKITIPTAVIDERLEMQLGEQRRRTGRCKAFPRRAH